MGDTVPHACLALDTEWRDFARAAYNCARCMDREEIVRDLQGIWTNDNNRNHVLPCLSVRSGLDLYLRARNFPPGSEVIMSAINIPDMVRVVKAHGLKVVPVDVSIETVEPKMDILPHLVTEKTVAILIAHIFGKWCNMDPIIDFAQQHNLAVIEDCAESFCGFERLGHPKTDIALFSFGVIKFCTAFGGAIAKVRDDSVFAAMVNLFLTYDIQRRREYLKKVLKYFAVFVFLDVPFFTGNATNLCLAAGIDHKKFFISMLRGFPDKMMQRIRHQPSTALLDLMRRKFRSFDKGEFDIGRIKGEYVRERLPESVGLVGVQAPVNNYWLFPILVENPDNMVKVLNMLGVDAYRGATQLNLVEPEEQPPGEEKTFAFSPRYPQEAKYLIDHVVYLPVHKFVPFKYLDRICKMVEKALKYNRDSPKVRLHAKL